MRRAFSSTPRAPEHDDGDLGQARVGELLRAEVLAREARHHQIEQDHLRLGAVLERVDGALAVAGDEHVKATQLEDILIVSRISTSSSMTITHASIPRLLRQPCFSPRGGTTIKAAPCQFALTWMVPPCACTMARDVQPSPEPPS